MKDLAIFKNKDFGQLRTITLDDEPYFVGKDVAEALGYANASKALGDHVDDEDKLNNESLSSLGQRGGWLVNESGLYALILSSKLPTAKKFKRWVTSEILPSIRKTGAYKVEKPSKREEIMLMNAKTRMAKTYLQMANMDTLSKEYKNILIAKASETLAEKELLPLPKTEVKTLSATEIGKQLGISAQKVGRIANEGNLKTAEFGEYYRDKSRYSGKEVDTFRYYPAVIGKFKEILKKM